MDHARGSLDACMLLKVMNTTSASVWYGRQWGNRRKHGEPSEYPRTRPRQYLEEESRQSVWRIRAHIMTGAGHKELRPRYIRMWPRARGRTDERKRNARRRRNGIQADTGETERRRDGETEARDGKLDA